MACRIWCRCIFSLGVRVPYLAGSLSREDITLYSLDAEIVAASMAIMWPQMFQNIAIVFIRSKLFTDPLLIARSKASEYAIRIKLVNIRGYKNVTTSEYWLVGSENYQPEVLLPSSFLGLFKILENPGFCAKKPHQAHTTQVVLATLTPHNVAVCGFNETCSEKIAFNLSHPHMFMASLLSLTLFKQKTHK